MVAHRKNVPPPQAFVPSSWFIVLTVMLVVGGAGWLGWLLVDDDSSSSPVAQQPISTSAVPTAPAATEPAATEPAPSPSTPSETTPTPTPTPSQPAGEREAIVSVLNNSGIGGAARTFSGKVTAAGWQLGGVGNWTGSIGANTVYYPPGLQAQAELLAADVDIDRIRPSVAPMRPDRLTIILSGPQ